MLASLIITFRETLEIALIVGIILSYLAKTKQTKYNNIVYIGIGTGIVASIIFAIGFYMTLGEFEGTYEQIFEGITMFVGAILLTTMILWMMKQRNVAKELQESLSNRILSHNKKGIFLLVFVSILREGVETVLFLSATFFSDQSSNIFGAIVGIILAIILGIMIFVYSIKIDLKKFFTITSIILILFSAGLVIQGVHEFNEAGILPSIVDNVWSTKNIINQEGYLGSFLRSLFGYTENPTLLEIIAYVLYLVGVYVIYKRYIRKKES